MIAALCKFDCALMKRLNTASKTPCSARNSYIVEPWSCGNEGAPLRMVSTSEPHADHIGWEAMKIAMSRTESGALLLKVAPRGVRENRLSGPSAKTPILASVRKRRRAERGSHLAIEASSSTDLLPSSGITSANPNVAAACKHWAEKCPRS